MKIRFKFEKKGRLKYTGHLDLLDIWNRALKSAKLPVCYSKGFNPHMLVSFAAPLPLGLESAAEYVDIDFEGDASIEDFQVRLNGRFPEGLKISETYVLNEPYKRVASLVLRAEYRFETPFGINGEHIAAFLAQNRIMIMKRTKRNNSITDISPDIFELHKTEGGTLSALLACGSGENLKPSLFLEAFSRFIESDAPPYKTKITRTEIYGMDDSDKIVPLSECYAEKMVY